jgi:hypothetical protein
LRIDDGQRGLAARRTPTRNTTALGSETKNKRWFSFSWASKHSKPKEGTPKASEGSRKLPPGVDWLFTKGKLNEILEKFETWNQTLESMIAPLLRGFGFFENQAIQSRLRTDEDSQWNVQVNLFKGHLDLNNASSNQDTTTGNIFLPSQYQVMPLADNTR